MPFSSVSLPVFYEENDFPCIAFPFIKTLIWNSYHYINFFYPFGLMENGGLNCMDNHLDRRRLENTIIIQPFSQMPFFPVWAGNQSDVNI